MTNEFGEYVRKRRLAAGVSLRTAALRVGVSAVYLGEVERGVRSGMPEKHWPHLVTSISGITMEGLERASVQVRGVQLSLEDAPPKYQDLGLALARRIRDRNLPQRSIDEILRLLGDTDE